jgi:Undecaprenyl-phosphate glucose phosphotransferase
MELVPSTQPFKALSLQSVPQERVVPKIKRISDYRASLTLICLDALALLLSGVLPALLYGGSETLPDLYLSVIGVALLIFMLTSQVLNTYDLNKVFEWRWSIRRIAASLMLTFTMLMLAGFATKTTEVYSRVWFFSWLTLSLFLIVASRIVLWIVVEAKLARGACLQRALIVSNGEGTLKADQLAFETGNRIRAIDTIVVPDLLSAPDVGVYLTKYNPEVVVLNLPWGQIEPAMKKLRVLSQHAIEVLILPQDNIALRKALRLRRIGNHTMLQISEPPLAEWDRTLKRVEDIIVASLALLLLAPLMAVTALAIRFESKGPILFKQTRAGLNGDVIDVWKFRSMYAEVTDAHAVRQTTKNDPRVTRVGRFIRRTSIDELPQFWNVLQGSMSIVGPRPHALGTCAEGQSLDLLVEEYMERHRVKPGITGWAQVNGARGELRSRDQVKRRVDYDLFYIQNWSILFDIKIILMTVVRVLHDPRAY